MLALFPQSLYVYYNTLAEFLQDCKDIPLYTFGRQKSRCFLYKSLQKQQTEKDLTVW